MPLFFHIVLAIGLVHAALLLFALGSKIPKNPFGFLSLILALLAVTFIIVEEWIVSSGAWQRYPHIIRISVWMPFLIGPGIWGFVKSLENPDFRPLYLLHLLPSIVGALVYLPFYVLNAEQKIDVIMNTHDIPLSASLLGATKAVSLFGYFLYVRRTLRHRKNNGNERKLIRYGRWTITAIIIFMLVIIIAFSAEHLLSDLPISSDLAGALGLGVFVFAFSILSIRNWTDFAQEKESSFSPGRSEPSASTQLLDDSSTEAVFNEILDIVTSTDMHKTQGLKLGDLAAKTGIAPHYVSYVVNSMTGQNFNQWLNGLRLASVREAMETCPHNNLLTIALDNGFNSKASFNRAFKRETGMSPSEYRNSKSHIIN